MGSALRLWAWGLGAPLWLDETFLALNVAARGPVDLLGGLDDRQTVPAAWVLAVDGATALLGTGERALRAVPLLVGLVLTPAVLLVGRRLLGPRGGAPAAALVAVHPVAVRYGVEVKPYGTDAVVAVLLVGGAALSLARGARRADGLVVLAAVVAVWCSYPAALVSVGCLLALAAAAWRRRDRVGVALLGAGGLAVVASAGLHRLVTEPGPADLRRLRGSYASSFRPASAGPQELLEFLAVLVRSSGLGGSAALLTLALAVLGLLGAVRLLRRDLPAGLLLVAPLLVTTAAGLAGVYPVRVARFLVVLLPLLLLLVAASAAGPGPRGDPGTGSAARALPLASLAVALGAALLLGQAVGVAGRGGVPDEDAPGLLAEVGAAHQPGDGVLLLVGSSAPYVWYGGTRDLGPAPTLVPRAPGWCSPDPGQVGRGRTWLLRTHPPSAADESAQAALRAALGEQRRVVGAPGASARAWLVDVRRPLPADWCVLDPQDSRSVGAAAAGSAPPGRRAADLPRGRRGPPSHGRGPSRPDRRPSRQADAAQRTGPSRSGSTRRRLAEPGATAPSPVKASATATSPARCRGPKVKSRRR